MGYIALGRPPAPPDDVLSCFPLHHRPSFLEIQELAGKGQLHTTDDGTLLLVRQPTPQRPCDSHRPVGRTACLLNDEPIRIHVPLLKRPWAMQACHSMASCHLGTTRPLRMLERFYWRISMSICNQWWLRHCLKCQARKTSRLTVRWPVISMPLPEGPGIAVTPRGNTYILLFTDRFSRRAGMYAVTAAELQPRA